MDLDPDKQEFIDAVTSPLKRAEGPRELLENSLRLASGMPTSLAPDALAVATGRMKATIPTSRARAITARLFTLFALGLGLWVLLLPSTVRSMSRLRMAADSIETLIPNVVDDFFQKPDQDDTNEWTMQRIRPDQRLVAMGEIRETVYRERWRAVWAAHPEDPAHFYAYALACKSETGRWPADWVATGEQLDPENGWFALIDACSRIGDAMEPAQKPRRGSGRRAPMIPGTPASVRDEGALRSLFTDIDHALAKPAWTDYRPRLHALRMSAWSAPADYPEQLLSAKFLRSQPEDDVADLGSFSHFATLFQGAALHFANTGNRPELDALADRYLRIFRTIANQPQVDAMQGAFAWATIEPSARAIENAYLVLGDAAAASKFKGLADAPSRAVSKAPRAGSPASLARQTGSGLATNWAWNHVGASPVTERELRGGRLAEYAMVERFLMHVLAGLLCFLLLLLLFSAHYPRAELRRLADRLLQLLSRRDWLWIIALGVLLPVTLYLLLQRLPWPGFRSWTLDYQRLLAMQLQMAGLALSLVLCSVEASRWRLAQRAWVLGFGWRFLEAGPAFALFALFSMPFMSAMLKLAETPGMDGDLLEAAIATAFGLPLVWALAILIACYIKRSKRHLHRLILLRACTLMVSLGIALSIISTFAIHAEEKKWTSRIEFESLTNENHHATGSRAGFEQARWVHQELKSIFGPLPE